MAKTSKGRQKIQMVKMDNESNLQVTFSKRRSGLFKKASELCTLCGADIAIIVFSPGEKAYSFGHPCVERVIDRFLSGDSTPRPRSTERQISAGTLQFMEMQRNNTLRELNNHLSHMLAQLELEKKRAEGVKHMAKLTSMQCRWAGSTENLDFSEMMDMKASLEVLNKMVVKQADMVHSMPKNPMPYYFGDAGSGIIRPGSTAIPYDVNNNILGGHNVGTGGFNRAMSPNVPYIYPCGRYY